MKWKFIDSIIDDIDWPCNYLFKCLNNH